MFSLTVSQGKSAKSWNTMPRSGPGAVIGAPYISTVPADGVSKPAIILSKVDLPHPDAPIRHTNSPLLIVRLTSRSASTVCSPITKRLLRPLTASVGRALRCIPASGMMLGAPCKQPVIDRNDDAIRKEAGESDDDHAGNHQVGARQGAAIHDHRAETLRNAGHFADNNQYPCKPVTETQSVEDRWRSGRQYDLAEQRRAVATEH